MQDMAITVTELKAILLGEGCIGNRKETSGPTNKEERILPLRGTKLENERGTGEKGGTGGGYGARKTGG
jgi:hypothetical protein